MARPRSIPDDDVLSTVRALLSQRGEKAVAFSSVAEGTGLAPASLVQRYGSIQGLIEAAAANAVSLALAELARIEAAEPDKGPQGLLKALAPHAPDAASLAVLGRSEGGRARAEEFRTAVEAAIARRLGVRRGARQDQAAMLFAAWIGQRAWATLGETDFRLKDLARKLS